MDVYFVRPSPAPNGMATYVNVDSMTKLIAMAVMHGYRGTLL
jgi:hypothetical protein